MRKKKIFKVTAAVFALIAVLCISGAVDVSSYLSSTNGVYAAGSTDTRTGVYQAKYTANGKTTTEWCYLKNGKVQYSYTGFASNANGWWYVEKGKVTFKKNDVIKGTVKGQSGWWFVKGSKVQFVNSVEKNSLGWWKITNGKADFNYTGIAKNANGWWYCKNGKVQFINSVEQNANGWWCIQKGKVNFNFTGFAKNANGWWYCKNGKVDFNKKDVLKGTVNGQSAWWFVSGGKVQFINSVEKNSTGWWCIQKGKVNFNYTGFAKNSSGWWYCKGGKVDFGKTDVIKGTVKSQSGWWKVTKGKVDLNYTGLAKNSNGMWYVEKGIVKQGKLGVCKYSGSWYYVNNGKVDYSYNGTVSLSNGKSVTIKKGKVTSALSSSAVFLAIKTNSVKSSDGKVSVNLDNIKKIYIYSYNSEFEKVLDILLEEYPKLKGYVEYRNLDMSGANNGYYDAVNSTLDNSKSSYYPSIFVCDCDWVSYEITNKNVIPLSSIGITDSMYADAYGFTKEIATNNGKLMAASWMACPGVYLYRRDIAKSVFGVSSPEDVQELVKDWSSFFTAAEKLKKAGKYIVSCPNDIRYAVLATKKQPWIDDSYSKLTLDSSVSNYLKYAKKLYDNGYAKDVDGIMWNGSWYDNMASNDVFSYFGSTWFMGTLKSYCGSTYGKWGACAGPSAYVWGGSYLMVGKNTPCPELCKFIIHELCCDSEFMYTVATNENNYDFINNKKTNAKLIKNNVAMQNYTGSTVNELLGGQSIIKLYDEVAKKAHLKYETPADATIISCIYEYEWDYYRGQESLSDTMQLMEEKLCNWLGIDH